MFHEHPSFELTRLMTLQSNRYIAFLAFHGDVMTMRQALLAWPRQNLRLVDANLSDNLFNATLHANKLRRD